MLCLSNCLQGLLNRAYDEFVVYEELTLVAAFAGDTETERLARAIQEEERAAARKVWNLIDSSCRQSFMKVTSDPANVAV